MKHRVVTVSNARNTKRWWYLTGMALAEARVSLTDEERKRVQAAMIRLANEEGWVLTGQVSA